jgi:hypothetical protein
MKGQAPSNWVATIKRFVKAGFPVERCELCAEEIPANHGHLVEIATRRFLCSCESCAQSLGAGDKFRLVAPKTELLYDFHLTDSEWDAMRLPTDIVFFFLSAKDKRPVAIYPSPAGGLESALSLEAWSQLVVANPTLADMNPDVEALLVNRTEGAREYYRVSIDRCYALIGLIRTRWSGLSGGADVWDEIRRFFTSLNEADSAGDQRKSLIHG